MRIEDVIIQNLMHDEYYCRKVLPFIDATYFADRTDRAVIEEVTKFFMKYNAVPSAEAIEVEVSNRTDLTEDEFKKATAVISTKVDSVNNTWLMESTEDFCRKRAVYNAIMRSIKIMDGKDKIAGQEAIPSILQDALAISFDKSVGHDFLDDYEARYDYYHNKESKIPFDIDILNDITGGGMSRKAAHFFLLPTGMGKTIIKCHIAAAAMKMGYNVLYITMEMAEERIAERIDANLLNIPLDGLASVDRETFYKKINKLKSTVTGKLIIKEYPTGSAHSGHFRALIEEAKQKKGFNPDVIIVDYLNIAASAKVKLGANAGTYHVAKSIAEELRGLAVEYNAAMVSSTQTNRSGVGNSDTDMTNTSESFGVPMTADLFIAGFRNEELDKLGQIMFTQLKNRYTDIAMNRKFVVGLDRPKMRLYDVEDSAQHNVSEGVGANKTTGYTDFQY